MPCSATVIAFDSSCSAIFHVFPQEWGSTSITLLIICFPPCCSWFHHTYQFFLIFILFSPNDFCRWTPSSKALAKFDAASGESFGSVHNRSVPWYFAYLGLIYPSPFVPPTPQIHIGRQVPIMHSKIASCLILFLYSWEKRKTIQCSISRLSELVGAHFYQFRKRHCGDIHCGFLFVFAVFAAAAPIARNRMLVTFFSATSTARFPRSAGTNGVSSPGIRLTSVRAIECLAIAATWNKSLHRSNSIFGVSVASCQKVGKTTKADVSVQPPSGFFMFHSAMK